MSYNVSDTSWYRDPRNDRKMLVYNSCCQRWQGSHVWDIKANRSSNLPFGSRDWSQMYRDLSVNLLCKFKKGTNFF